MPSYVIYVPMWLRKIAPHRNIGDIEGRAKLCYLCTYVEKKKEHHIET